MQSAERLLLPLANRTHHSLRSKEWERTLPPVSAIKKHQSQKLWCKHLYALHTARWESRQSAGTDALTLRFAHSQCRFCVGDSHPVPLCRLSPTVFRMPIFSSYIIMHFLPQFVNPFNTKHQSRSLFYQKSFLQSNFSRFRLKFVTIYYRKAYSYLI